MLFSLTLALISSTGKPAATTAATPQAKAHSTALAFVNDLRTGQYPAAVKLFGDTDATQTQNVTVAVRELANAISISGEAATIPQPKQAMSAENISAHANWKSRLGPHDVFEFLGTNSAHGKCYFQFEFTSEGKMTVAVIGLDKSADNDALLKKAEASATAALAKPASQPAPAKK